MEETYNTQAIILDRLPFKENDTKIIVFSRDKGKLDLVAKGARRTKSKTAGHIEPLTLSKLMVIRSRNDFDYVGTALGEVFFDNIKNNIEKINYAGRALKLVNDLSRKEEGEGEQIFLLLLDFLLSLDIDRQLNHDLLYNFFILKFLSASGFSPNIETCVDCNKKIIANKNSFLNLEKGGIICNDCHTEEINEKIFKVSDEFIKILKFSLSNNFDKLVNLSLNNKEEREVKRGISSFLKYNF